MMEHSVIFPDHRKVYALGQGTWKMGKSALREADEIDALLNNMQQIRNKMSGDFAEKVKQLNEITKKLSQD